MISNGVAVRGASWLADAADVFVLREVVDLYSKNDYYVDRIFHALRDSGVRAERFWDAERKENGRGAHLRILYDGGDFVRMHEEFNRRLIQEARAGNRFIVVKGEPPGRFRQCALGLGKLSAEF